MRVVSRQDSKSSKQQVSLLKQLKTKKPNLIHAFTGANVMDGGHFGTSAGTQKTSHAHEAGKEIPSHACARTRLLPYCHARHIQVDRIALGQRA
jgi:hypothetical protein